MTRRNPSQSLVVIQCRHLCSLQLFFFLCASDVHLHRAHTLSLRPFNKLDLCNPRQLVLEGEFSSIACYTIDNTEHPNNVQVARGTFGCIAQITKRLRGRIGVEACTHTDLGAPKPLASHGPRREAVNELVVLLACNLYFRQRRGRGRQVNVFVVCWIFGDDVDYRTEQPLRVCVRDICRVRG